MGTVGMQQFVKKLLYGFNVRERWQLLGIFMLMLIGAGLETLSVSTIPAFVALLNQPEIIQSHQFLNWLYTLLGATSNHIFLLWLSLGLLVLFVGKNLYLSFLSYYQYQFLNQKQIALANRLLKAYLYAPYTFHLQRNTANLSLQLTSEVTKLFWNVLIPAMILVTELTVTTFLVVLLVVIEPFSSAIALFFLGGALYLFSRMARQTINRQGQLRQYHDGQIYQWINQGLGGIKETKILGKEPFFINAYTHHKSLSEKANVVLEFVRSLSQLFIETVVIAAVLLIVIITVLQSRGLQTVLPTLSLFAIAALRIMPSVKRIASTATSIRYYRHVADVIFQDLSDLESASPGIAQLPAYSESKIKFNQKIELKHIFYQYPKANNYSIADISLTIPKSSSVAFVGPSGAGKSTLVDVILGLLTPSKGSIYIDGVDIQTNLSSWQQQIGYIPQSIYLSDDTIRRNIAFGVADEEIDDAQVWSALQAAQLEDVIDQLPERLDTLVGEQGIRLSGGQRQRIGIARALYHNPQVLVMDEATAALDNQTEREFVRALENLSSDKTLIMIAHRLSTVKNCDRLYFIDSGRVLNSGTYEELLEKCVQFRESATSS
jgi:ABC-type multidrug transport system fused ATPase/permease subunit